jgi:hypothetical protein
MAIASAAGIAPAADRGRDAEGVNTSGAIEVYRRSVVVFAALIFCSPAAAAAWRMAQASHSAPPLPSFGGETAPSHAPPSVPSFGGPPVPSHAAPIVPAAGGGSHAPAAVPDFGGDAAKTLPPPHAAPAASNANDGAANTLAPLHTAPATQAAPAGAAPSHAAPSLPAFGTGK